MKKKVEKIKPMKRWCAKDIEANLILLSMDFWPCRTDLKKHLLRDGIAESDYLKIVRVEIKEI